MAEAARNLEQKLKGAGNVADMLRNSQIGAYVYPVVPPEFTNWRDEQRAWRETAVLFDQSHHMAELMVEGPDAMKLLSRPRRSTRFENFAVEQGQAVRAVQLRRARHRRRDHLLSGDENKFMLVGRAPTINWVQFHGETGGYDVTIERDDRSPSRPGGKPVVRKRYRYQVQGPNAPQILEKLNGGPVPDIKFFNMDEITIAGRKVRALRHGMVGVPGLEVCGPVRRGRGDPGGDRRGRARISACARSARGPTRPTRWNRAGSRRRCRPSIPARR